MKCPKCGSENKDGANFCASCRHNFNEVEKFDRQSPKIKNRDLTLKEEPKEKSSNIPIIACLAIIIIGVLMVAVIANNSNVWTQSNSTDDKIPVDDSNNKNLNIPQNNKSNIQSSTNGSAKVLDEHNSTADDSVAVEDNYQSVSVDKYSSTADDSVAADDTYQSDGLESEDELSATSDNPSFRPSNRIEFEDLAFKLTKDKTFDIQGECLINDDGEYTMVIKLLDENKNQLSDFLAVWDSNRVNYNPGIAFDFNHYAYGDDLADNEKTEFVDVYIFDRIVQSSGENVDEDLDLSTAIYYQRVPVS